MGQMIGANPVCFAAEHDHTTSSCRGPWPFVELTIRVPLREHLSMGELTHEEALAVIKENLGAYIVDEMGEPGVRMALRLRHGGEDRCYPLKIREDREDEGQ